MLKEGVGILVLNFFNFLFNFIDLFLLLLDFLLVFQLALIVVLDDLQLFQSFCQNFIFVEVRVQISSDRHIIFLKFFEFLDHLFVDILFDSWQQSLFCSSQIAI